MITVISQANAAPGEAQSGMGPKAVTCGRPAPHLRATRLSAGRMRVGEAEIQMCEIAASVS